MLTSFSYHVYLTDDGEGEGKCFTFTLYLGSHTHIFKIKIFNQNPTFKSIELLDKLGKKMILTKSCELWGKSRCVCLLLHLKVVLIRCISCPGLARDFSYLTLLNFIEADVLVLTSELYSL